MSECSRQTLEAAFEDWLAFPQRAGCYVLSKRQIGSVIVEFHFFRIGFASFLIALIDDLPAIICDMRLDDGEPVYATVI